MSRCTARKEISPTLHIICECKEGHPGYHCNSLFYWDDKIAVYNGATLMQDQSQENIDHPKHYGGADNPYEAIKVIEAWGLDFCLGNAVKYICRAGKKGPLTHVEDLQLEDLKKAAWYLNREIERLTK